MNYERNDDVCAVRPEAPTMSKMLESVGGILNDIACGMSRINSCVLGDKMDAPNEVKPENMMQVIDILIGKACSIRDMVCKLEASL